MKKLYVAITIFVFLMICSVGIHAQTTQPKLNQAELLKQITEGKWQCEIAKDTFYYYEGKVYGTGSETYYKIFTKDKIIMEGKALSSYDKRIDKQVAASLEKGKDIAILAYWFTSDVKYIGMDYNAISNPEKAPWKIEGEIKSPDMFIETIFVNNKPIKTDSWKRVK